MANKAMQSAKLLRHSTSRKAEKPIGQAGNGDRRPERKGVASTLRDLRNDPRPKTQSLGLPDSRRSEAPSGVYEGTESLAGDACCRKPGYSHLAEPPNRRMRTRMYGGVGGEDE